MLKINLFWVTLFSLNTSAESVKKLYFNGAEVGIEAHHEKVWIRVESSKGTKIITEPSIEVSDLSKHSKEVLEQSWARYPEDMECKWLHDCRKICKDIYNSRRSRLFCGEFPKTQVDKIDEMDSKLTSFGEQILKNEKIDPLDLDILVTIDSRSLEFPVKRFSSNEARTFLAWMAKDGRAMDSFQYADDNNLSEELLKGIKVEGTGMEKVFTKDIYDGKNFIELALNFTEGGDVKHMNVSAFEWMETVFENRCYDQEGFDNSYKEITPCIFKEGFCQIGLTEAHWKALLTPRQDFVSGVQHTVSTVLDNFTTDTPPEWWVNGVEPINLGIAEINALCQMDFVKKDESI